MAGSNPRRRGAQPGNRSALRHGLRAATLPASCRYVEHSIGRFRDALELATLASYGAVDVTRAALISSACRHERRAALLERWLRLADDGRQVVTMSERISMLREISAASDARDRAIAQLALQAVDQRGAVRQVLYLPDNGRQSAPGGTDGKQN